jgi:hypothetical protein
MSRYLSYDEITRMARRFVREHGQAAPGLVRGKEQEALTEGNLHGVIICRRLLGEIESLLALEPATSARH